MQMFEVALLRRMCCSRACSVSVKPGLPSRSTVRPMMRPGICRTCSMRVAMKPKYGPPEDSGTPSGCPSPQAMSAPCAPHSPGGFSTASDVGFTTPITSAPFACAQSRDAHRRPRACRRNSAAGSTTRRDVLACDRLRARPSYDAAALSDRTAAVRSARFWPSGDRVRDVAVGRIQRDRQQDARDFELRFARTAIRHASASADAPS